MSPSLTGVRPTRVANGGGRPRVGTDFLRRDNPIPAGTVLLTGTGIVPPDEVTLVDGMIVETRIPGIAVLRNPVAGGS